MKRLVPALTFLLTLASLAVAPARAQVPDHPHAANRLISDHSQAAPGSSLWVAVDQTLEKGWHTYWRNPGDAGAATTIAWTLPAGWSAGPIVWPAPKRLPLGPIMNYGYEGRVALPVKLTVPAAARAGQTAHLAARVDYLVCADVCVPETANVALDLPVGGAASANVAGAAAIKTALAQSPQTAALQASVQKTASGYALAVAGAPLAGVSADDAYFYPYDATLIDQSKPQTVQRGPRGLTLALFSPPGPAASKAAAAPNLAGALVVGGHAFELAAAPGPAPAGAAGLPSAGNLGAFVGAAAFAFLGGLILNLMPCVFPILSMKAAALAGGGESQGRTHGLAFAVGVLLAFAALGAALILARAGGAAVGWGFQLQSPLVTAVLALIMLAAALNLFGVYEIGTSLQGAGGGLAARAGLAGSFFTGVLAVVVAAPCTAPFMGPAVGFALVQPWPIALAVFLALGAGFAAPFTLVAFTPALLRRLPRPGPWMETFRKLLAFPMYAAAAWLAWVFASQADAESLLALLSAAVILGLAAWLFGMFQRRRAMGAKAGWTGGFAAASLAICVATVVAATTVSHPDLAAQPWSPQAVAQLQGQKRPVLVNFTARWCVTCQVNDRVAFSTAEVAGAFKRTGAAYLVADWTNRDAAIEKALAERGRAGVPLYLVYGARGGEPVVLPQLLTPSVVAKALDAAVAPHA